MIINLIKYTIYFYQRWNLSVVGTKRSALLEDRSRIRGRWGANDDVYRVEAFLCRAPVMKIMSNSIPSAPTLPNAFWVKISCGMAEQQNQNTDNTVEDHSDIILFSVRQDHGLRSSAYRTVAQTSTSNRHVDTTLLDTASTTIQTHQNAHIGHHSPTECAWCWFRARESWNIFVWWLPIFMF